MSKRENQRSTKKDLLDRVFFTMHVLQGRLEEEPYLSEEMVDEMARLKGALLRFHRRGVEYKLW